MKTYYVYGLLLIFSISLVGCGHPTRRIQEAPKKEIRSINDSEIPNAIGTEAPSILNKKQNTIEVIDDNLFISQPLVKSEVLPNIEIDRFTIANASVGEILRTILMGTGIPFTIDNEHPAAGVVKMQMSANDIGGKLTEVLNLFSDNSGFYYTYTGGTIRVSPDKQFIAKIPPINEIFESLPLMLTKLGATDVFLDKSSRALTYRANKSVQSKVSSYLGFIRDNKKLIVFDTYIAEVILNDSINTGIQWNKLGWGNPVGGNMSLTGAITGGAAAAAANGTIGAGAVLTGGNFNIDVLASFLKSQGTVNQLSKIPMMMLAGGEQTFRNGNTDYYVSSVGAPTVGASGQTIPGSSVLSALHTGLDLTINGDIYDGTVYTKVNLIMNTLIGYQPFPAGNGTSQLAPRTTERTVLTDVRIKPGDTILIAGINYEKYQTDIAGLPGKGNSLFLMSSKSNSVQKGELVIVMSPRVISFSRKRMLREALDN